MVRQRLKAALARGAREVLDRVSPADGVAVQDGAEAAARRKCDQLREQRDTAREQREAARRQRAATAARLDAFKKADVAFYPLASIDAARCPACDTAPDHLCTYPFDTVAFSRLVVLWCPTCGMGWVPEVPFDLDDYYGTVYAQENRGDRDIPPEVYFSEDNPLLQKGGPRYFTRARAQIERAREHHPSIEAMLDFGAGPGYALWTSGARLKHAIEKDAACAKYLDHLGAERLTLESLPESTYDLVLSSHSLEHLVAHELVSVLERLRRALEPKGLLYVEVPSGGLSRLVMPGRHEPHTLFFTPDGLRRAVVRAGFEVVFADTLAKRENSLRPEPVYTPPTNDAFASSARGQITVLARPR